MLTTGVYFNAGKQSSVECELKFILIKYPDSCHRNTKCNPHPFLSDTFAPTLLIKTLLNYQFK